MKVIIGMATMQGREKYLEQTVRSLENQTVKPYDMIIYDNAIEQTDLTDNGKFFGLIIYKEPVYYFTVDDDLIYHPTYIERTIEAIEKYNCIVTYHGRILKGEGLHYYRGHKNFRCLDTELRDIQLDVCGTGVTAFRTDYFNPAGIHRSADLKMSDLVFSLEAAKQGKRIMHLAHNKGFIKYQDIPVHQTIHGQLVNKCDRQGELADEIYRLRRCT